jgi:hypothetical protein
MNDEEDIRKILRKVYSLLKQHYRDEQLILDEENLYILVKRFYTIPINIFIRVEGKHDLLLDAQYTDIPNGDSAQLQEWYLHIFRRRGFYFALHEGKAYIYAYEPCQISSEIESSITQVIRAVAKIESRFLDYKDDMSCAASLGLRFD